jgi:hypothetical protein
VTAAWLEELEAVPVISPKRWAELSRTPRSSVYDQIANGSLPSIRLGSTIQIPTVPLRKLLGAEDGAVEVVKALRHPPDADALAPRIPDSPGPRPQRRSR